MCLRHNKCEQRGYTASSNGTGPVGSVQLAEVIDNPDYDLVGLFVYSPDKVGVDAGALVGRPDTGIVATNDKAAILALDADVVLASTSKAYGFDANTDDIVALLESGKSVVTVTSYAHLPTLGTMSTNGSVKRATWGAAIAAARTRDSCWRNSPSA